MKTRRKQAKKTRRRRGGAGSKVDLHKTDYSSIEKFVIMPEDQWNKVEEGAIRYANAGREIGDTAGATIVDKWITAIKNERASMKKESDAARFNKWNELLFTKNKSEQEQEEMEELEDQITEPVWVEKIRVAKHALVKKDMNKMFDEWKDLLKKTRTPSEDAELSQLETDLINAGLKGRLDTIRPQILAKMAKKAAK